MNDILTKPEQNLINKLATTYGLVPSIENTVAVNPYTGVRVNTTPRVASLVHFVQQAYRTYELNGTMSYRSKPVSISFYDRVRYLVLKLDKTAYAEVLD